MERGSLFEEKRFKKYSIEELPKLLQIYKERDDPRREVYCGRWGMKDGVAVGGQRMMFGWKMGG